MSDLNEQAETIRKINDEQLGDFLRVAFIGWGTFMRRRVSSYGFLLLEKSLTTFPHCGRFYSVTSKRR